MNKSPASALGGLTSRVIHAANAKTDGIMSSLNGKLHETPDCELDRKLRELSLLSTPERTKRRAPPPTVLGDVEENGDDHPGRAPRALLSTPSPRTNEELRADSKEAALAEMTKSYRSLLTSIGEDPNRDGLLRTPQRAAKALLYFTKGYDENIAGRTSLLSILLVYELNYQIKVIC